MQGTTINSPLPQPPYCKPLIRPLIYSNPFTATFYSFFLASLLLLSFYVDTWTFLLLFPLCWWLKCMSMSPTMPISVILCPTMAAHTSPPPQYHTAGKPFYAFGWTHSRICFAKRNILQEAKRQQQQQQKETQNTTTTLWSNCSFCWAKDFFLQFFCLMVITSSLCSSSFDFFFSQFPCSSSICCGREVSALLYDFFNPQKNSFFVNCAEVGGYKV